jgi:hypothetical protein
MDISGLDKGDVLSALYNHARVVNRHADIGILFPAKARIVRSDRPGLISRLYGRNLMVDLSGDELDTAAYNRHNGPCSAESALIDVVNAAVEEARLNTQAEEDRGCNAAGAVMGRAGR